MGCGEGRCGYEGVEFGGLCREEIMFEFAFKIRWARTNSDAVADLKEMKDERRVCRAAKFRLRLFV
jgi:hypothetical protein